VTKLRIRKEGFPWQPGAEWLAYSHQ
jgi:hypothetical protein